MFVMNQPRSVIAGLLLVTGCVLLTGCGGSSDLEVIDLNKVLTILDTVAKSDAPKEMVDEKAAKQLEAISETNVERKQAFAKMFAKALNDAKLVKAHLGIQMSSDGTIRGFTDRGKDGQKGSGDQEIFKLEIDTEKSRIIATQTIVGKTYRRDHHYSHGHYYGRHWGYYTYGSMWGHQRSYYSQPGRTRPNYSQVQMSPKTYHSNAVSQVRSTRTAARSAARSSARSSGGSRSFSGGK